MFAKQLQYQGGKNSLYNPSLAAIINPKAAPDAASGGKGKASMEGVVDPGKAAVAAVTIRRKTYSTTRSIFQNRRLSG